MSDSRDTSDEPNDHSEPNQPHESSGPPYAGSQSSTALERTVLESTAGETPNNEKHSYGVLFLLILSGEAIFLLPFVLPRIFRPTVIDAFAVNNTELGQCYSAYGLVALFSYFFGGPLADQFPPRKLMAFALWTTALGGLAMATYPSLSILLAIYTYWGFTTIFLFWAAMLKATRQWGGASCQGRAYGFLDGGRGMVSAAIGSGGVLLFASVMGETVAEVDSEVQRSAFRYVILATSLLVMITGILVWNFLVLPHSVTSERKRVTPTDVLNALNLPSVWLLMIVVLCGYVGYKVTDDFSLFARDVMGMDEVKAAQVATWLLYVRPIVGIIVGFLADWTRAATWILAGFVMMLAGAVAIGMGVVGAGQYGAFAVTLLTTSVGVYAIRSLYFAAMQEGNIPLHTTGTAIGLISVIGFTPDIFMGPVMGYLLDSAPGAAGHQNLFRLLAGFATVGLIAATAFRVLAVGPLRDGSTGR